MKNIVITAALALLFLIACSSGPTEDERFIKMADNFLQEFLKLNPEYATYLGDHRYDHLVSDMSPEGIKKSTDFYRATLDSLSVLNVSKLSTTNQIDYGILKSKLESWIFQMEEIREHEWNPLNYNVGNLIYPLLARDFAPLTERLKSVKGRLEAVPNYLQQAKSNLSNSPRVHVETAILQNPGSIILVREQLNQVLEQAPEMEEELAPIQQAAIEALEQYGDWLENELLPSANGEFRLGEEKYRKKLRYTLASDLSKEEILASALSDLETTTDELYETALPLYKELISDQEAQIDDKSVVIKAVLDKLAQDHPTNETIVSYAAETLKSTTAFVREQNLVTVPDEPVKIIVMPEFQRGVAVAYCDSPGPLEKGGETFYAISPTPASWSEERVQSFFREYNNYMIENLTVHEAMPGHYLQIAHSNKFEAPTKIRAIFYSGPFVEGWATYSEQLMVEHGYGGPEVKMQQLKMRLRLLINAIIDQKIHTEGMTEQEAMDLMMNQGFQEEGEAAGKWRRACMTSTQLSTYYVGNLEVNDIRAAYEEKYGPDIDYQKMHDEMLSYGSPPAKYVKKLMGL